MTGLTLSNIEAVGLRNITEKYMDEFVRNEIAGTQDYDRTVPFEEIPERFFYEFYDMEPGTYDKVFRRDGHGTLAEETKEWFRREQERRHLI